jgi:glycosyltransferase involved in cell wall biosynthesis
MCQTGTKPSKLLFSIITVCRNAQRSIDKTIQSVVNQAEFFNRTEHLVIDGASTDGTLQVLEQYPHLRVVSEPDSGMYDAMNKGVRLSRGECIGILNADDWYEPGALAAVAEAFRLSPEVALVHGDIRRWNRNMPLDVVKSALERGLHNTLAMPFNHPACFVKRELFSHFGGFDHLTYPVFADYDWARRVIDGGVVVRYCPRVLTNFQLGGVSTARFAIRERYRVFRANGGGMLPAWRTVAYSCAVVLRNRLRRFKS